MTGFFQSIITIVLFILILGVLVVIHELGHFFAARLARVRVLEFGVGFPPRAKVLRSKGETLYTLNWLPIGGFVKLEGEDGTDADDPRSFSSQRYLTKILILVAGVAMNVVLAFAIFTGIALYGDPAVGIKVGAVQDPLAGAAAGITTDDTIVSINGRTYAAFGSVRPVEDLQTHAGETVTLGVKGPDGTRGPGPGHPAVAERDRPDPRRPRHHELAGDRPAGSAPLTAWARRSRSAPSGRWTRWA